MMKVSSLLQAADRFMASIADTSWPSGALRLVCVPICSPMLLIRLIRFWAAWAAVITTRIVVPDLEPVSVVPLAVRVYVPTGVDCEVVTMNICELGTGPRPSEVGKLGAMARFGRFVKLVETLAGIPMGSELGSKTTLTV